ncbi:type II TA system antitoxin MqsA family protein [Marimonas arenosa]|uniref:Type II toxin-antitoxin system MqsA family antitoxin n=1 Tax=Marimonas arenosa TaxID=1795305 RepID=A0AAE3WG75_9RHOB|nr:type II TA system antitoxin MqsA family protein [Marimonas arenosa]MDQ2091063.1 type II toxin-antitoxin system MqsA family antitoxin [Marimonas arenosa]
MTRSQERAANATCTCAICGHEGAKITMVDHEFDFKNGNKMHVLSASVPVVECDQCEEAYFAEGAEEIKHEAVCDFLGRLTPRAIVELRGKLNMSQAQLAKHTGIGIASIKRWEAGLVIQNAALDKQLRALEPRTEANPQRVWNPTFRTTISASAHERARNFSLRPNSNRQLEAA